MAYLPGHRLARRCGTGSIRRVLISATLSRAVAESHFDSEPCPAAALLRRQLPVERLFMTFLETSAMNGKYLEAEAVLFGNGRLI